MTLTLDIPEAAAPAGRAGWVARIRLCWGATFEAVLAVGQSLIEARAALPAGEFGAMVESDLPFTRQTAYKLIAIAEDRRLTSDAHVRLLPPSWGTLYELTKLDDGTFSHAVTKGLIRPDMERKEAERLRTGQRRGERLARSEALAAASPGPVVAGETATGRRYPVVYVDPPWDFEIFSDKGLQKAARLHYPTMAAAELAALPVPELAADDAVMFMWTTTSHLAVALRLMEGWGFAYKSHCVWIKTNADGTPHRGHGYWFIGAHEVLLVGSRGDMPAPLPGTQSLSAIAASIGRHSEKPALFRRLIEDYFPGVAKIELFARGILPPGWDGWGNEYADPRPAEAAADTGRSAAE